MAFSEKVWDLFRIIQVFEEMFRIDRPCGRIRQWKAFPAIRYAVDSGPRRDIDIDPSRMAILTCAYIN